MSSGRSKSWRSASTPVRRGRNQRAAIFVSAMIIALVGAVIFLILADEVPRVHFRSLVSVSPGDLNTAANGGHPPFSGIGDAGHHANAKKLNQLFKKASVSHSENVAPPEDMKSWKDLRPATGQGQSAATRQLIYLSARSRIAVHEQKPILELLLPEGNTPIWDAFENLLNQINSSERGRQSGYTVLLLELSGSEVGLFPEAFSVDVFELLRQTVENHKDDRLAVICAFGPGQRSWEYLREADASEATAGKADDTAADGQQPYLRRGTAFGHFVAQAFHEGQADTVEKLHKWVQAEVSDYVKSTWRTSQEVHLLGGTGIREELLFSGISLGADTDRPADEAEGNESETAEAASEDNAVASVAADATEEANDAPQATSLPELLEQQWREHQILSEHSYAVPARDLFRVHTQLLEAEQLRLHDYPREARQKIADVKRTLTTLNRSLHEQAADAVGGESSEYWLNPIYLGNQIEDHDCLDCLDELASGEPERAKRPKEERTGEFLARLTKFIVQQLKNHLREKEGREEKLTLLSNAFLNFSLGRWDREDLPHQLVSLQNLLTNDDFEKADAEKQWDLIDLLLQLLELRTNALNLAMGRDPAADDPGQLLRKEIWDSAVKPEIQPLLKKLTAAESWLQLGTDGIKTSNELLDDARKQLDSLLTKLRKQATLQRVRDAQLTEIPYLINFLAAQRERDELTDTSLQEWTTAATADAGQLAGKDDTLRAMLTLTGDLGNDAGGEPGYVEDYELLWDEINRVVSEADAADVRQLQLIPAFNKFRVRSEAFANNAVREIRSSADAKRSAEENRSQTGFWTTFFSLRILEARTGKTDESSKVWTTWREFLDELQKTRSSATATDQREIRLMILRAELADGLLRAWKSHADATQPDQPRPMFVARGDSEELLKEYWKTRECCSFVNRRQNRFDGEPTPPGLKGNELGALLKVSEITPQLNQSQQTEVKFTLGFCEHHCQVLMLGKDMQEADSLRPLDGWTPVEEHSGQETTYTIALKRATAAKSSTGLRLIIVTGDRVLDAAEIRILPDPTTTWDLQAQLVGSQAAAVRLDRRGDNYSFELPLPPALDPPTGIKFRVQRTKGIASQAKLQLFPIDQDQRVQEDKPVWISEKVDLDADGAAWVPLRATSSENDKSETTVSAPDLSSGFCIRITPVIPELKESQDSSGIAQEIKVIPVIQQAEIFVSNPEVKFNPNTKTLTIEVQRSSREVLIPPPQIPLRVHFSSTLRAILQEPISAERPDVSLERPAEFSFQLKSSPKGLEGPGTEAEFYLDVAGIPRAYAWRITADQRVESLDDSGASELRTELDFGELQPVRTSPVLLLDEAGLAGVLIPQLSVHGPPRFWNGGTINLDLISEAGDLKPISIGAPLNLNAASVSEVRFQPADDDAWNVSVETKMLEGDDFTLEDFGLASGRYKMRARLFRQDDSPDHPSLEWFKSFIVDSTPPEKAAIEPQGESPYPVDKPVQVKLTNLQDAESGLQRIEAGFDADKLQVIWPKNEQAGSNPQARIEPFLQVFDPEDFLPFLSVPGSQSATLSVVVTNGVGKTSRTEQKIEFRKLTPSPGDDAGEPQPGTIVFVIDKQFEEVHITCEGQIKRAGGGQVIRFSGLQDGMSYRISCKYKRGTDLLDKFDKEFKLEKEGSVFPVKR